MNKTTVGAMLRVLGGMDPEYITKYVGMNPTKTWAAGDSIQGTLAKRRENGWVYAIKERESYDVASVLRELIILLEGCREKLFELSIMGPVSVEFYCPITVGDGFPSIYLDCDILNMIVGFGASLDFDLM